MKKLSFLSIFLLIDFLGLGFDFSQVYAEVPKPDVKVFFVEDTLELTRITAYNPVDWQTWGDPNVSSCGPNQEKQIALSRDLFFDENGRKHLCGKRITIITDRGEIFENYVIWDTMNPRFINTADIMFPEKDPSNALEFGVTAGIIIFHTY
jgi:hypothetical protein